MAISVILWRNREHVFLASMRLGRRLPIPFIKLPFNRVVNFPLDTAWFYYLFTGFAGGVYYP
jgi:hypothetical protein